jgi:hypothetical protein
LWRIQPPGSPAAYLLIGRGGLDGIDCLGIPSINEKVIHNETRWIPLTIPCFHTAGSTPSASHEIIRNEFEKFPRNYIWRKITGDVTIEFLEGVVDRMFNADEITSVVDLVKLQRLKLQIVSLFLKR